MYPFRPLAALALGLLTLVATAPRVAVAEDVPATASTRTLAGTPAIAVASSLRAAWPALERAWRETLPGIDARPTFGASRTLSRQIARGAPFELFLAADVASVDELPAARTEPATARTYAYGRLALLERTRAVAVTPEAPRTADTASATGTAGDATGGTADAAALAALSARLTRDPRARLGLPNPEHAPYGRAAREAFATAGHWPPVPPGQLVVGENAAQALQFLRAGAVAAALVPQSLAAPAPAGASVRPIEATLHAPLEHRLVLLAGASPAARALADWFATAAARAVLAAAGFEAPP